MTKTFKTKVYLNPQAVQYCTRAFGVRRCIWNWAVAECLKPRAAGQRRPSNFALDKLYRQYLNTQKDSCFVWLAEQQVSPMIMQEVLKDVDQSFKQVNELNKLRNKKNQGKKNKDKQKLARVHLKRRKDPKQTFRLYRNVDSTLRIESDYVASFTGGASGRFEIRTSESLAFLRKDGVKLCTMTIKCVGGVYWMCLNYEKPNRVRPAPEAGTRIGIDLGVVKSVCAYDGSTVSDVSFNDEHSLRYKQLAYNLQKRMSRQNPNSNRYAKNLAILQKNYEKAARVANHKLEEYTTYLVENYEKIVVDDYNFPAALNVADHRKCYQTLNYQFKLRLEQKLEEQGRLGDLTYVEHKKGVKTTRKCSGCGCDSVKVKRDRQMYCPKCGLQMDRDENAARNAYKYSK